MLQQGARAIVHVSSIQRRLPSNSSIARAAARAAPPNYSKSLANQFGLRGIRVNSIATGFIETAAVGRFVDRIAAEAGVDKTAVRLQVMVRFAVPLCDAWLKRSKHVRRPVS